VSYNYEERRKQQSMMSQQPIVKFDYLPWTKLRGSYKLALWGQPNNIIYGTLPGFNDSKQYKTWLSLMATTINYSINPTTFVEGTFGKSRNDLAGCVQAQSNTGPTFCESGLAMNDKANPAKAGLGTLPRIFPDAGVIDKSYYAYNALQSVKPPTWDGTRVNMMPGFSWGGRIGSSPPNFPFPGWLNVNKTTDIAISLTKLTGRHTLKTGFYNTHSYKAQQRQGWAGSIGFGNDTQNPLDSGFGFANAALGVFSSYNQYSRYVEGNFVYNNTEAYVQDNWKVTPRLTLDYGLRFVHQQPQYDMLGQGVNFLPDKWTVHAPVLGGAAQPTLHWRDRQARPAHRPLLGPNTSVAIGTPVPFGNATNGLFAGQGIPKTTYNWPALGRFVLGAYDLTGKQRVILRRRGLFSIVPPATPCTPGSEPAHASQCDAALLPIADDGRLTTEAAPAEHLRLERASQHWHWNAGVQVAALVRCSMLLTARTLQHCRRRQYQFHRFRRHIPPQNQDSTVTSSIPGGAAVSAD
jgi:hypothetical protein